MSASALRLIGCNLHANIPNADTWIRRYEELHGRPKNLQPVFDWIGAYMVTGSIQRNFEAEGRPSPWAPLSPDYAEWKAAHYPGQPILQLTGRMVSSFHWRTTMQTLKIWNTRPYWAAHQFGYGPRNLPARIMLLLQDADKSVLTRKCRQYWLTGEV